MKFDRSAVRFGAFALYALMQCTYAVAGSRVKEASVSPVRSIASLKESLGQSATLLPSGNMLLVGGPSAGEMSGLIAAENPQTGAVTTLPISLVFHRAFHTATLLPDGSVLVFGGIGIGNRVVPGAEDIDVTNGSVQPMNTGALTPRANHTATLLTDGTILFAGGADGKGATLNSLEIWNFRTGTCSKLPIQLQTARRGHEAALLANGSVLIWGGVDAYGNPVPFGEVIDPQNLTSYGQRVIELPAGDPQPPLLVVSIPADDASNVAVNVMIALRFSKPLQMASVNSSTLVLTGPSGAVSASVIPAEGGMLAFVQPLTTLEIGSNYTLDISGTVDNLGQQLADTRIAFSTTESAASGATGLSGSNSTSDTATGSTTGNTADSSVAPPRSQSIRTHFTTTPVPFERMRQNVESSANRPKANVIRARAMGGAGTSAAPEIVALANGLHNDPDLIYQYVHDNIEFSPLFGALKGPVGTLLDGRGDSFDQASLMVALLNQASLSNPSISNVLFEFGTLDLTNAQLQTWLGVDSNPYSVGGVLAQGGIPGTVDGNGNAMGMGHVWVKVSINGTPYVFDPAFKAHSWKPGVVGSLASALGYSRSQFLADANPASLTSTSIQGVNRTQLRSDLTGYANNLSSYIQNTYPTAGVSDIIGGGVIVPTPLSNGQTLRQAFNPNQSGTPTDWTSIPSQYNATISITLPGARAQTYNSSDIYGHRLSIFFSSTYVPTLYLDGTTVTSGSASTQGTQVGVQFKITIPWSSWASQTLTQNISAQTNQGGGSGGYVIQTGWDQVGRGMIEKHRSLLNQAIASGAASNSELVLGESLEMLGLTWLAECAAQQRIADQLLGTTTQYLYGGGIVGEAVGTSIVGPYVDLPMNAVSTPARINGASTQTANSLAAFADASGVSSSFESASLEQTQARIPGFVAASTIKLLDTAVQNGNTIYDINNSATGNNWSTIQPILAPNYNSADLTAIGSYVSAGDRVIAPSNGKIAIGNWTGVGYKTMSAPWSSTTSYGELISGQMNGGSTGTNDTVAQFIENMLQAQGLSNVSVSVAYTGPGSAANGGDPISLQKGSSQYQHDDLDVGSKGFPYGLNFQRIYDSNAQRIAGPLGNGWTHNYAVSASVNSDGFTGMGQGAPLNSARSIAALYVSSDLMNGQALNGQTNLENYVVEAIVNRWFTDQVTSNIVTVQQGWNSEEFVQMPNGSYSSPVGSASILDVNGGNLRYRTKSGVTMTFGGNPTATSGPVNIASLTSPGGASVSFSYSGGNLTGVSNSATGRSLNINYSGSQISSVSDGTGRSVSYTISGGNLTQFTDAQQQNTTYSYDTSGTYDTAGHLTQIFYPSNPTNAFVTNYYDGLGHVWKQLDANKNTSQVFASGARMEIDDAAGNRHVYINDPLGNVLEEIQDYGNASHLNATTVNVYNAQSLLVSTTMPEGNSTTFTYDALFNPTKITQYPKPGSGLSPVQQTITYTHPVSAQPSIEAPYQVTDAKGNFTTYKYDSNGNVIEIDQPSVPKPGAPSAQPTSLYTYTSIGMVQTATDPEGRVTRYDYFAGNADQVQKMTVDYGRLNYVTQYTYDNYGNVCTVTDPNNNVTVTVHDALGRVTEEDAANALSITKYDYYPNGQVHDVYREQNTPSVSSPATCTTNSTETSPVWETTTYTYTPSNKVYQVTDPLGNTTTTAYDGADRVYTVTQPVSSGQYRVNVSTYDVLSRPYQTSIGSGASTSAAVASAAVQATYAYTLNGMQKSIADANNNLTDMTYDGFDRLSNTIYPDSSTEQFQYDANNNVTQKTTRSGQTISSSYDALNRLQTKTPQGEAAGTVTYGYDYSGRMLQASDGSSSMPYQIGYDTAGQATSFTDQLGRNTQVAYDEAGNQTEVIWPAGTSGTGSYSVIYKYDAMNQMQTVNEGGTNKLLAQYSWDALSRAHSISYGDGTSDSYSQYDAGDNLQTLTQTYNGSNNSATFNYTWLMNHQRNSAGVNNPLFQYVPQAGTVSYGTANADNGLTTVGGTTMTYDGNYNLTYDGTNTLSYDVENRLIQAVNPVSETSGYLYDPLGHRKQKVVGVNTVMPVATDFVLAGGEEIADYYETSATWRLTVRGVGGLPLVTVVPGGAGSEEIVYVHHDLKGSTVALTEAGSNGPAEIYNRAIW